MGTGLFRVVMVLLWALGGMVIALGLFNGDYELALLGAVDVHSAGCHHPEPNEAIIIVQITKEETGRKRDWWSW